MRIIVVGCGRVGSTLAYQLYKNGHQVTVIDQDASAFDNLSIDFRGRIIEGDVLAQNVMHRAEIEDADALAAVTRSDSLNALISHIARTEYHVSRVVARNFDPRQQPLQEAFGIPVVGAASWGAQRIEELLSEAPLRHVFSNNSANLSVYQLEVPASWNTKSVHEFLPGNRFKLLAWIRAGQSLPIPDTQNLENGDFVILSAEPEEIEELRNRLDSHEEQIL